MICHLDDSPKSGGIPGAFVGLRERQFQYCARPRSPAESCALAPFLLSLALKIGVPVA